MSTMLCDITKSSVAMYNSGLLILKNTFMMDGLLWINLKCKKLNRKLHFYDWLKELVCCGIICP